MIGRGAFGIVWRALEQGAAEHVAIKIIQARDSAGFTSATFEAELMRLLTASSGPANVHMPTYMAHSAVKSDSAGTVKLAMSYMKGGPLDKWLYGISDEEHKTVRVDALVQGPLPGGRQGSMAFARACGMAHQILVQLSSVFVLLEPVAFHRDVSSHNVLLDVPIDPDATPHFSLIDFGLAVRSGSWKQDWRSSNLAGDPRYWTPAAWMAFAYGFRYLQTHPKAGFQRQYVARIDHFAVGVLALEVVLALWRSPEDAAPGMEEVRAAWSTYWSLSIRMFQMFHTKGAQEVRNFLTHSQDEGVTSLADHLRRLRQALKAAAKQPANRPHAALLLIIADLVNESGTASWGEVPAMLSRPPESVEAALGASGTGDADRPQQRFVQPNHVRSISGAWCPVQELVRVSHQFSESGALPKSSRAVSTDSLSRLFAHRRRSSGYF